MQRYPVSVVFGNGPWISERFFVWVNTKGWPAGLNWGQCASSSMGENLLPLISGVCVCVCAVRICVATEVVRKLDLG